MRKYFALIAFSLVFTACKETQDQKAPQHQALRLPVIQVPEKTVMGHIAYPVSIEGMVNSEVRPKVAGYITKVLVDEGAYVHKGQILFRLETHQLTQEAQAAKANVNAAQVGVDQLKPLVAKEIISKVQLETAEAKLAQAKANYNSIMANINYAQITSPVNGYVGAIPYRNGSLVTPSTSQPLTTVSDTKSVFAYFAMNEADYLDFLQNTEGKTLSQKIAHFPKVSLLLANGTSYSLKGRIETVTAQVDPSTGTVSFRAVFPNPDHLLANGSSGTILIPKIYSDAVVVPEIATFEQQGFTYVYQVMGDSIAVSRIVHPKDHVDNLIVVDSGIHAGDKIVAEGVGKLDNNTPVTPVMIPFDSVVNSVKTVF